MVILRVTTGRAANQFSANLLMPSALVHEAYAENDSTTQLAQRFEVSELAMGYRLIDLGLR
jgi:Zn-dependent peptidase ImmA (M78 family)